MLLLLLPMTLRHISSHFIVFLYTLLCAHMILNTSLLRHITKSTEIINSRTLLRPASRSDYFFPHQLYIQARSLLAAGSNTRDFNPRLKSRPPNGIDHE